MNSLIFKTITYGSPDYNSAVGLREETLRRPWGKTFLPEELELEKDHIQIAGFMEDEIVATSVLAPEGCVCKMQRVAVKANHQDKGIGSAMIKFCEEYALSKGFKEIYCHARDSALRFYLKNNYVPAGNYFNEDSIPHLKIRKILQG